MIWDPVKYSLVKYQMFIPGFNSADLSSKIWTQGADPARLIEPVTPSWNALLDALSGSTRRAGKLMVTH